MSDWGPSTGDVDRSAPGHGVGFALLLVVIGLMLLAFAWGAVVVVLDVVTTMTGMP